MAKINFVLSAPDAEIKSLLSLINDVPVESSLRDINAGYAFVYLIKYGNRTLGLEVCRIDISHLNEREFTILRCVKAADYNLKINFWDILDVGEKIIAPLWGCGIIRRHVDRAGMIPALQKYDYNVTEIILKRKLKWEKATAKVQRLQRPRLLTRI